MSECPNGTICIRNLGFNLARRDWWHVHPTADSTVMLVRRHNHQYRWGVYVLPRRYGETMEEAELNTNDGEQAKTLYRSYMRAMTDE